MKIANVVNTNIIRISFAPWVSPKTDRCLQQVAIYDVLISVDGVSVNGLANDAISRLVTGQAGSMVRHHLYIRTFAHSPLSRFLLRTM
jgi:hypothetical protein